MGTRVRPALLTALIGSIALLAWLAMWSLEGTSSGLFVHTQGSHAGHQASRSGSTATLGATFVIGWVIMTIAMMLPTVLPLLTIFQRLTSDRSNRALLVGLVVAGYLAVWTAFGAVVFASSVIVQAWANASQWLMAHPRPVAAGLFLVAGAFQFSDLKYRCLERCRTPLSFVSSRWRGTHEHWQSFRLGLDHGVFCVGCCWALMLLMFVAGVGSLVGMLTLGSLMAIEKNVSWGRRIAAPLGVTLIALSAGVMLYPR
jgi:predicted metal-binding membrane protein